MRRRVLILLGMVAVALIGLTIWDARTISRQAANARGELQGAIADAKLLTEPAGRDALRARIDRAAAAVLAARRQARRSIPLRVALLVPGLHRANGDVNQLIDDAATAVVLARQSLADVADAQRRLTLENGRLPLAEAQRFEQLLGERALVLRGLVRTPGGLVPMIRDGRRDFNAIALRTADQLDDASRGLAVARALFGGHGPRTHLFGFMNNAEMRHTGMVLSYGVARARDGRIAFERTGPIGELEFTGPADVPLPQGTARLLGDFQPTERWHSVNATADFAWTGRAAAAMYKKKTGAAIDGFIGVDVPALARLLRVIGPIRLDPWDLTADNVGTILLHEAYQTTDQGARRERMADLGARVMERLTTGRRDVFALGQALADAAAGGHIRVWSASPEEESHIERIRLGGPPGIGATRRTFHVAVLNMSSNKLDYYLRPTINTTVNIDGDSATVRVRVELTNTAPKGLPNRYYYDLGPSVNTTRPGEYAARVLLWAPPGSVRDGIRESGLDAVQQYINIQPGTSGTVEFVATLRNAVNNGRLALRFVPQPRLNDSQLTLAASTKRGRIVEAPPASVVLARPLNAVWRVN